jgi:hypothetical protein
MKSLRQLQQEAADKAKDKKGNKQFNTFGLVLSVKTAQEHEGALKLTGIVLNTNPNLQENEEVAVVFRGDSAAKSITNFKKGGGKLDPKNAGASEGTFLTLESCYLTEDKDGERRVINSRWLNTLASSSKKDQDNRSFIDNVMATAPRISFVNPDVKPGEPKRITLPVNAKTVAGRVETDHGTFDKEFQREWALEKLKGLPASEKCQVHIDMIEPAETREVKDRAGLEGALRDMLARGTKALALLRVSDGEDVVTRAVYVPFKKDGEDYVPDVDKALEDLFKNNVFKGIPNEDLMAGLASGGLKFEAIPGYRLTWAGDTTKDDNSAYKLVEDVKANRIQRYELMFGTEANRFAKVILPGMARKDSIDGFSPINVLSDAAGTYLATEFGTKIIERNVQPHSVAVNEADPAPDFAALEQEFDAALAATEDAPAAGGPRP